MVRRDSLALSGAPTLARRDSITSGGGDAPQQVGRSLSTQSGYSSDSFMAAKAPKREMIMPFQPLGIGFSEINYTVDMPSLSFWPFSRVYLHSFQFYIKLYYTPVQCSEQLGPLEF